MITRTTWKLLDSPNRKGFSGQADAHSDSKVLQRLPKNGRAPRYKRVELKSKGLHVRVVVASTGF